MLTSQGTCFSAKLTHIPLQVACVRVSVWDSGGWASDSLFCCILLCKAFRYFHSDSWIVLCLFHFVLMASPSIAGFFALMKEENH